MILFPIITTTTISSNVIGAPTALYFTNYFLRAIIEQRERTVGCHRKVKVANRSKSTQLNPPIAELITITITETTFPEKTGEFPK